MNIINVIYLVIYLNSVYFYGQISFLFCAFRFIATYSVCVFYRLTLFYSEALNFLRFV